MKQFNSVLTTAVLAVSSAIFSTVVSASVPPGWVDNNNKIIFLGDFGENVSNCCGPNAGSVFHKNQPRVNDDFVDTISFNLVDDALISFVVVDDYRNGRHWNQKWNITNMSVELWAKDIFGDEVFLTDIPNVGVGQVDSFVLSDYIASPAGEYMLKVFGSVETAFGGHYHYCLTTSPYTFDDRDIPAIPEPETWAILLAGLGLIGLRVQKTLNKHKTTKLEK